MVASRFAVTSLRLPYPRPLTIDWRLQNTRFLLLINFKLWIGQSQLELNNIQSTETMKLGRSLSLYLCALAVKLGVHNIAEAAVVEKEVCVVGGGAAGAYTAYHLQKRGYDTISYLNHRVA